VGIPLLALEIGIGQTKQRGAIGSFRRLFPSFGGLGILALISAFVIVSYYTVVMAWSLIYFFGSFQLNWSDNPGAYFNQEVLKISEGIGQIGGINWPIFLALIVVWILIYFSVWQGTKSLGKILYYTVPLPFVLLVILFIRAITLEGFLQGWELYLNPVWSAMGDPEVWRAAFSQIFFTLTLGFGVMIAYASYRDSGEDIVKDTWITALLNSAVSLFAGFVVFGVLGYMATQTETPLEELAQQSGPGLAFVIFPEALSLMPLPWLFSLIFFLILLTLGIDSAFSLVEAINTVFLDRSEKIKLAQISLWVCLFGFLAGLIYTTRAGLYFLDVVDHFVTSYNLILVGVSQALLAGWIYGAEKLRREINQVSSWKLGKWWNWTVKYFIVIVLTALLVTNFYTDITTPYGGYPGWALGIGWLVFLVPLLLSVLLLVRDQVKLKKGKEFS
jgi:NSS family neurotransmitter:Na+ symporter